ncbi:aminoglycoside phosphotransferase family protein [Tepidibacter hydrothermalis]|uniref:Aminoglycoside phosphotransferase family protein n=1 Tax=Tepidibacter hydrothermalis TaxID=3036126 RepID=A0ABY8EJC6_9FIRM|nr:aminoglycoside phosphotransferase family protein [Tepidibacter hydrothermalis]WFD11877.1 aminoglycoside phosphotransferase family protein [Tepidibacter hydrothermalis]
MSTKMGRKINEGSSAEVFEWENDEKIIKLAKNKKRHQSMLTEYLNSQVAWDNGVSVPQPFGLVDVDGRPGIIFERIYGETLMERFVNQKGFNYEDVARITAKILSETHGKKIPNIRSQREAIIYSINGANYLTNSEKKLVVDILNNIPIKEQLCHGDPNLNNILIRDNKALLIDWRHASIGNPETDLAEYILMTRYAIVPMVRQAILPRHIPSEIEYYINSIKEEIIKVFIDEYTKLSDITSEDIDSWIIPMAARRLSVGIIPKSEKEQLVGEIRRRLKIYK